MRSIITRCLVYWSLAMSVTGCRKLVEVDSPDTKVTGASVYDNDATAAAVLTNIYADMSNSYLSSNGIPALSFFSGLSSDEFALYAGANNALLTAYYANALAEDNTGGSDFWNNIYPVVYITNAAIEGLNAFGGLTPAVRQQLLGEAYFMRAFCYFYLVNLYGDVPLAITTDYKKNALLTRAPRADVWVQIVSDLHKASDLLSSDYLDASVLRVTTDRVRPTTWAAASLLARAYLYTQDWKDAGLQASRVIDHSSLYALAGLDSVFLMNNAEAIWQLQPVRTGQNTMDGFTFALPPTGPNSTNNPVYLSEALLNSFEAGDQRRKVWVDSVIVSGVVYYFPYKYKSAALNADITEYEDVFRLGEIYLIRAEARAQQNSIALALDDLDAVRARAGLAHIGAGSQADVLAAIRHERQVELFSEWGHRWMDLKRTGTVDEVMSGVTPTKGGTWNTHSQLYPIPLAELQHDPNLVQNDGY
jgi:hypothetical protein